MRPFRSRKQQARSNAIRRLAERLSRDVWLNAAFGESRARKVRDLRSCGMAEYVHVDQHIGDTMRFVAPLAPYVYVDVKLEK